MGDQHHQQQQGRNNGANGLDLPPGFRFHPLDEEIITSYLRPRVLDHNFTTLAVGDADLNKSEPWELPLIANMGETEWYFYCRNDRKYPTGNRANRATAAGYWKATGKDKEIYSDDSTGPVLVGLKKTLVFYEGRAPKGVKTDWVMHEYRLPNHRVWTVCRVFHKCSGIKKTQELAPTSEPEYHMTMGTSNNMDMRSADFPMPTNFSMEQEDFTMGSSASFYSDGMSLVQPVLSSMIGMSSMGINMNTNHFEEMMAMSQPMPFYQQEEIGMLSDCNFEFIAEQDSRATSVPSTDDARVSLGQNNYVAENLSVVTEEPVVAATTEMDSTLKH